MIINSEQKTEILTMINEALNELYECDSYLITNRVNERSIVFRFGYYFQRLINNSPFSNYNMDCEYNKNHSNPKRTINFRNGTYPDIILHRRGRNGNNLLLIEFKTWWQRNNASDIQKIKDFTDQNGDYKYAMGLSIILNRERPNVERSVIVNGEVING